MSPVSAPAGSPAPHPRVVADPRRAQLLPGAFKPFVQIRARQLLPATEKAIEVEGCAKVGAGGRLLRRQRDASRIGDPVDGVEQADDTRRVDQPRRTSAAIGKTRAARSDTRNIYVVNSYLAIAISIIT